MCIQYPTLKYNNQWNGLENTETNEHIPANLNIWNLAVKLMVKECLYHNMLG